jgi:hypothetical protein
MKENKLEIICRYLANGLLVQDMDGKISPVNGIVEETFLEYWNGNQSFKGKISDCKPILYPINCLCKKHDINRDIIIPIVELAKIEVPGLNWQIGCDEAVHITNSYTSKHFGIKMGVPYFKKMTSSTNMMSSNGKKKSVGMSDGSVIYEGVDNYPIKKYHQIVKKLNEWKIDYMGLIESGDAINVETLAFDPYKTIFGIADL